MVRRAAKSFWAACLSWCCFRRAAPRAVGSRSRVGLLARPSAAVGGGGVCGAALWPRACRFCLVGAAPARRPATPRDAWLRGRRVRGRLTRAWTGCNQC